MYQNLKLLRDIVDNTPSPIAVYSGEDLKIELANRAMITTWGKGDQVVGKNYSELLPEIEEQQIIDQALSVIKTGVAFHAKDRKVDLVIDGIMKTHYFDYSFIPLINEEGKIYGVMNTGTDITVLHQTKLQIQNVYERLKIAVESSDLGTYEIDLATQKILTSGNFNTICEIEGEIDNEQFFQKLHPEDKTLTLKEYEQALITGKMSFEARIQNNDQSINWIRIHGKIIKDEYDNPETIIGIVHNINSEKQFAEELKKQVNENTQELKRSNDDLLHFANVVSHDLKEPVRKIRTFNSILKNEAGAVNENFRKHLTKVDQSAKRMQTIIDGILTYSTLDKKNQPVEKVNLNEVVENIKTDLELIINEKNAILVTSELPEIEGAPILIQQLFYNVIHNALKFSKNNEPPKVIITAALVRKENINCVQITIKDNGIGLETVYAEKIFNAFERLHSKDDYEGNGLGLSLCRKIAKRHKGNIIATGEINKGAEFIITLPLEQQAATI